MSRRKFGLAAALFLTAAFVFAQSGQWITFGHDPQRSGNATDEHAFSLSNVSRLGLVWKTTVPNEPLFLNGLTAPLLIRGVKTSSGVKNIVIVAGSFDHMYAMDAETGDVLWKSDFEASQPRPENGAGWLCPYALNDTPVIDPKRARVFVVSGDGRLHTLDLADGHELIAPLNFVPAWSKMWSLNYSEGVLYASLSQDCNHVRSGVVGLDPDSPGRPIVRFFSSVSHGAGIWGRGGASIGFDGFIYGATGDAPYDPGAGEFGDTILRLEPRTLRLAGYYAPQIWEYITRRDLDMGTSTPVIFRWHQRVLAAVGGKEGAIYVVDTAKMAGTDHQTAAYVSPRYVNSQQTFEGNGVWGEMSAWTDAAGTTWLYVPTWGEPTEAAKFPVSYGAVKNGSIMAFRVVPSADGKPKLSPAWISADIAVPDPAVIAGGVLFVLGTGENPQQVTNGDIHQLLRNRENRNTGHAILHALDAKTGRELWSSGDTMAGWTHFSGLAVGDGKIFASTHDGAVYAFALRGSNSAAPHVTVVPGSGPKQAIAQSAPLQAANTPRCGETSVLFVQRCSMCHGADGRGISATQTPNFTSSEWQTGKTDQELINAITNGTLHGMPAFGGALQPQQIDQLVHCQIRGFAAPAPQSR